MIFASKAPEHHPSKEAVLSQLLKKERNYYKGILDLTLEEQEKLMQFRPLEEIVSLTRKRKILFSCIEEIHATLSPLKMEWETHHQAASRSCSIEQELLELQALIKLILDKDKENQHLFKQRYLPSPNPC